MATLPSSLALTGLPADGGPIVASSVRNDLAAVQVEANALLTILGAGTNLQVLQSAGGTTVNWGGSYSAYTPTWAASGTQPVLGNGTLAGRFVQFGKLVHFYIHVVAGTTTTFGTGSYTFGLPVTGASVAGSPLGPAYALDSSASVFAYAAAIYATTATFNVQQPATWPTGIANSFGQTAPWTWATSDTLDISGTYEAA